MTEPVKRLTPKPETLREIFLKSGNICAFPGCTALMMNAEGVFIGNVCHIEAAEEDGQRFNKNMSNEDRRKASNLMLMCYPHHKITDNVDEYPPPRLQRIKADHEKHFARPDRAILETLTDWTTAHRSSAVHSLKRMHAVLGWKFSGNYLTEYVTLLNEHIIELERTPANVRQFLGAVAGRINRMKNTRAVFHESRGWGIMVSDLMQAFNITENSICEYAELLDAYGIGSRAEVICRVEPAYNVYHVVIFVYDINGDWDFWIDLAKFCELTSEPMEPFTVDLSFSRLD